jgi:hypothetical protein
MARIDVVFVHEDTLDPLGVASMVCVPRKDEDIRLMQADGSEVIGTVSFVQWTIQYDEFGNPSAQDVEIHLSIHTSEPGA